MIAYTTRTGQSCVWSNWTSPSYNEYHDCTSSGVWVSWQTSEISSTATTIDATIWQNWQMIETTALGDTCRTYVVYPVASPKESKEQEALLAKEREENKRKARELEEQRRAAEERAVELLMDIVGPEEAVVYKATGNLLVKGHKADWLIGRNGSVRRIEKGKVVSLCLHSDKRYEQPETDNVVALALHAKFAEQEMAKGNWLNETRIEDFVMPRAAVLH